MKNKNNMKKQKEDKKYLVELTGKVFEYQHEGKLYGFHVHLDELEDPQKHLQSIKETVVFAG